MQVGPGDVVLIEDGVHLGRVRYVSQGKDESLYFVCVFDGKRSLMKVGFTCSTFDLLHAGHIIMLREAKEQCDYPICGLQVDPKRR